MEKPEAVHGHTTPEGPAKPQGPWTHHWHRTVALFLILSAFWILLSGRIGLQYFLFMLVAVGTVLFLNPERPLVSLEPGRGSGLMGLVRAGVYFVRYLAWLMWNVLKANVEVARIILHPRLPIRPQLLLFRTSLRSDLARVLVANSITLTPGTVTVDLSDDGYLVHVLAPESAGAVTGAELQNVVGAIFGEAPERKPRLRWVTEPGEVREVVRP